MQAAATIGTISCICRCDQCPHADNAWIRLLYPLLSQRPTKPTHRQPSIVEFILSSPKALRPLVRFHLKSSLFLRWAGNTGISSRQWNRDLRRRCFHHQLSLHGDQVPADRDIISITAQHRVKHDEVQQDSNDTHRRIHILGTGSIGKLVAYALRDLPVPPPTTLLLHRGSLFEAWQSSSKKITLLQRTNATSQSGFEVEMARAGFRKHGRSVTLDSFFHSEQAPQQENEEVGPPDVDNTSPILHLIVAVKATSMVGALLAVRHRLTQNSTILFLQNGMGILEQVNEEVFNEPGKRPHYVRGIISHGVNSEDAWTARVAGLGTIQLGQPTGLASNPAARRSTRYLIDTVCRSPMLAAISINRIELLQRQLEKLAVNAIINPTTALLDARNGAILQSFALTRATRLLIAEIGLVIRQLPELRGLPNIQNSFSSERLETLVKDVALSTSQNISSMLADVRAGRKTEIDYINGYIVRRGEELGIKCLMNYLIMQLVKGKHKIIEMERTAELPMPPTKYEDVVQRNLGTSHESAGR